MINSLANKEYKINDNSFAFYKAKKTQFWMTFDIEGISKTVTGSINKDENTCKGSIKIDIQDFDSQSKIRNEHVRDKYLNVSKYPFITYDFEITDGVSKGVLNVSGAEKQVSFPVKIAMENNQVAIEGEVRVKYTDFNIQTPANFILKAHEDLVIGAKLFFSGTQK